MTGPSRSRVLSATFRLGAQFAELGLELWHRFSSSPRMATKHPAEGRTEHLALRFGEHLGFTALR